MPYRENPKSSPSPRDVAFRSRKCRLARAYRDSGEPTRAPRGFLELETGIAPVAVLKVTALTWPFPKRGDADFTTEVEGDVYRIGGAPRIYVMPNPSNSRVTFHEFLHYVRGIPSQRKGASIFFVGDVGYQKAAIQEMGRAMLPVVPMKPTTDKRSRLQVCAPYIKNGTVLFPRTGCEQLLTRIFELQHGIPRRFDKQPNDPDSGAGGTGA